MQGNQEQSNQEYFAKTTGKLYGIGIGPGDSELLTLKAAKILNSVDVIFAPRSAPKRESIAKQIIEPVLENKMKIVELTFPMTKSEEFLDKHWDDAAKSVMAQLKEGKNAAFITLGDPFFYSTYIYLYRKIKETYPYVEIETVPGISSVFAAASVSGIPLAIGQEKIAILPLPDNLGDLIKYVEDFETVVILKIGARLKELAAVLEKIGKIDSAVIVQKVSQEEEKVVIGLSNLTEDEFEKAGYLSIAIIKK